MASQLDLELPSQDVVKCVVVGDSGVGKTRLVCARACGTQYSLQQLVQNHVPTVWAIDHYRLDKHVVDRSWCMVDNVQVSLRLWDTFGYHDKDRRFAYGRADVILVCFSVARPKSLMNVLTIWYPEIKRLCPGVPIILCGCQVDLRHLCLNVQFQNMEKGVFYKNIQEEDILVPEEGREVARQIGAFYYETSVLEGWGIRELFENVTRAALVRKRSRLFWNQLGHLKNIGRPAYQTPYLPPKPPPPQIVVAPCNLQEDMAALIEDQWCQDVIFKVRGVSFPAHKICLIVASEVFEKMFYDQNQFQETCCVPKINVQHNKVNSLPTSKARDHQGAKRSLSDTAKLLDNEELCSPSGDTVKPIKDSMSHDKPKCVHPAVISIEDEDCEDFLIPGSKVTKTVVTLTDNILPVAFNHILRFLYTGTCEAELDLLPGVESAAELLMLPELVQMVQNLISGEEYRNKQIQDQLQACHRDRAQLLLLRDGVFADVAFHVDDGYVMAHKALLTARSHYMRSMFQCGFRESSADVISFPGVSKESFRAMLSFLYIDFPPNLLSCDFMELIQLGNQLCLPRLLMLVEQHIMTELETAIENKREVTEEVVHLLESAQLHNANQLASWCTHFICTNYLTVQRKYPKLLNKLSPENQIHLSKHRWPPVWYLREQDIYEKHVQEMERERLRGLKFRHGSLEDCSGCLAFCGRRNRKLRCGPAQAAVIT